MPGHYQSTDSEMNREIIFNKYKNRGPGYHWSQISKSITERNIFVVARYNMIINQIGNCQGTKILDIGCGDGALTYLLACRSRAQVTGVDTSTEAIAFAREKIKNIKNIEFIEASAYDLPFKDNSIDYVVSSDVIEHLAEPEKLLTEIKRVFNENGRIVITTPLRFTEIPLDKMHVQEFFESELKKLLNNFFGDRVSIILSHPLVFMELQNRHFLIRRLFNLLNLLFKWNPFITTKDWRYYAMQTAIVEGRKSKPYQ